MRGLVFTGGEGPPPELCGHILAGARAGGLLCVAADSGLSLAEAAGAELCLLTGDMDSLEGGPERLISYGGASKSRLIIHPRDKDYTDTELALNFLWEQGCTGVWILGGGGGRADHLLALASLFERRRKPERWVTAREDIRLLEAPEGDCPEAFFSLPGNTAPVSVFPLGKGPWKIESRGLLWPLGDLPWERGFFSISNEITGETFDPGGRGFFLRALAGSFLVLLPLPVYS